MSVWMQTREIPVHAARRAANSFVALVTVLCTVAAYTTANADIDKSTVKAGRVHIKGKIDTAHDLVVRIDRGDKPIEWRSSRTGGGEFEVVVEASDKIRLEDGKTGHGFVVTTKILTSSAVNYVHCAGDLAGTFAIRREADFVIKDGVLTFADITLKDGTKLPVSLRLALSRAAAPVHSDSSEAKPAEAITQLGGTIMLDETKAEPDLQEKLDVYLGKLKHGSVEQRREAVLALDRIGERAKAAAPALAEALKSEDPSLRVDVAEALWQANKDPAAVTALAAALKDKDWRVFQIAAEALDRIGPEAKAAVPALLELLNDGWVWERKHAAWAATACKAPGCGAGAGGPSACFPPEKAAWLLWRIDKHPAVMPALLNALKDPAHRSGAARTLGRIGMEAKEAVPVLLKLLDEENGATRIDFATEGPLTQYREALTYALWQINQHPAYIPALVLGLKDKDPSMRVYYIKALGRIGPEAKGAVPALAEILKDEKEFMWLAAAEALGRIGVDAVPTLLEALKDRGRMRVAAAEALWRINKHPAAVPALAEALTDQGVRAEGYANPLWVLSDIGAEAKAAAPALAEALKDKNVAGRVEVAVTLWKINQDPAVVPVLVDALKDMKAKDSTRVSAAKALWQINQHPAAVPALVEVVNDLKVNGYTRMFAAQELWQINKHPAAVTAQLEVLKDKDAFVRNRAAEALWQINRHPAAVPALVEALKNRDNWVGSGAARILGRIGAEAKVVEAALTEASKGN